MREIRCANMNCHTVGRGGRVLKPRLVAMVSSTGAGRVEIKCSRCGQMNIVTMGQVFV